MPEESHFESRLRAGVNVLREALGGELRSVVLFGSRARGRAGPDSDADLLVVVDGPVPDPLALRTRVRDVLRCNVDLYLFTVEELRANFRLLAPVVSTFVLGIKVLYDRGAVFRTQFRRFLPRLGRSHRLHSEGGETWDLPALARDFVDSHASSLEPLVMT